MNLESDRVAVAARNNADWCDAMARAHGAAGAFTDAAWINRRPAPRFHPNLVTLGGPEQRTAQMDAARHLLATPPGPGWAVKDSFAALDLAPLGFALLFEALWIRRPARAFDPVAADCIAQRVTGAPMLAAWERAWSGGAAAYDPQFPASLLGEPDHAIIAVTRGDAILGGCIASRSQRVLGISNLFAPAEQDDRVRVACLGAAMRFAPGLPLVGYERGADLARMIALGFADIGRLRIWQAVR